MWFAPADAPCPSVRRAGANVAEPAGAVRIASHALDEFRIEALNDGLRDAERPEASRRHRARFEAGDGGEPERAEKASRRGGVDDSQQEVGCARQRAEGGVGQGLNVGAVDVATGHRRTSDFRKPAADLVVAHLGLLETVADARVAREIAGGEAGVGLVPDVGRDLMPALEALEVHLAPRALLDEPVGLR